MKNKYIETEFINKCDKRKVSLDLSALNILEAAKIMTLASAYHYKKFPNGKIICKTKSNEIKDVISMFSLKNLEVVTS